MKKILLIAAVASLAFTACKKDRTCHCRTVTDFYASNGQKVYTDITETDKVMTKTKRTTAFNSCIHRKTVEVDPTDNSRMETDDYCELK